MREIVVASEPITRHEIRLSEAIEMFRACGDDDKVRLLEFRQNYLTITNCAARWTIFTGTWCRIPAI